MQHLKKTKVMFTYFECVFTKEADSSPRHSLLNVNDCFANIGELKQITKPQKGKEVRNENGTGRDGFI